MTPDLRATIVAKLRAEADRLERDGGYPDCIAVDDCNVHEVGLAVDEAIACSTPRSPEINDAWAEDVEFAEWGVYVAVQRAAMTEIGRSARSGFDHICKWELVDADLEVEPRILPTECPECGVTAEVHPDTYCPTCLLEADAEVDAESEVMS